MQPAIPVLVLALAQGTLRILGGAVCPDPVHVREELTRLNPTLLQEGSELHLAMVQPVKDGLQIRLFAEDGHVLEERVIPGSKSCAEWARTVAVVLVSWEAEFVPPAPVFPAAPVIAVVQPPPRPVVQPKTTASAAGPAPSALATSRSAFPPHAPKSWMGEIGVGLVGSIASDGATAPGLEVRAALDRAERPYGGQLTLLAEGPRDVPLGSGSASWERFALGLGGHVSWGSRRLRLDLGADFLAALLVSRGVSFAVTRTSYAFQPGLMASARLGWRFAEAALTWLQVAGVAWLGSEQVQVFAGSSPSASQTIPGGEFLILWGVSLLIPL